jgi:hypothetical protein
MEVAVGGVGFMLRNQKGRSTGSVVFKDLSKIWYGWRIRAQPTGTLE